ncbi:enoyl-CoA hydratase [Maritalea mobilis]|uniref:3-hydroxyisobutyryl-CoA hydrolase n=1 Tax=Maritalea mobilis TaxID=483324 RepID=A0A4R6VPM2_9HYPH|nr:enoyl-CoA hydratase/isomerase family protein [Maritalea mobilis]TDQ64222.1 enoyl-CoA hydratase [Maritalea mobilis]
MSDQKVLFAQRGKLGEIKLNRPKALNSLDLDMIDAITAQLTQWEEDQSVSLILLSGEGEKGFCAGGDVKAVRSALLADGVDGATAFFDREYALYQRIAKSNIPIVSMQHGIVMGGGIGLSGHAQLRLVREGARFAMPEKSIGFFTDVAVNHLVKAAPFHQRVAFLLTGDLVGPADAMALNLSDILIAEKDWDKIPELLAPCADETDPLASAKTMLSALAQNPAEAPFVAWADQHKTLFEQADLQAIIDGLGQADDEKAQKLHAALVAGSPTSLVSSFLLVQRAASINEVGEQFALESELARYIVGQPDFAEGVRAVLVDKDNAPNWQPASIAKVSRENLAFLLPH